MPPSLTTTESKEFQDIAPEVFELLHCVYKVGNKAAELQLKSFMEGLAGLVEDQEVVHPPPWEPIPETYNPPKFGKCYCLHLMFAHHLFTQGLLYILLTRACEAVIHGGTTPDLTMRSQPILARTSSWVDEGKLVAFLIGSVRMGSVMAQV